MAHVRKGMLAASKEWAVHLRPYGKRQFWGEHRQAEKAEARKQLEDHHATEELPDAQAGAPTSRGEDDPVPG